MQIHVDIRFDSRLIDLYMIVRKARQLKKRNKLDRQKESLSQVLYLI